MVRELKVAEITPEYIIRQLDQKFLKVQPDGWILKLYGFLNEHPALRCRLADVPLIRLEDGTHVVPKADGRPSAFLPSEPATEFPTVRGSVCATEPARAFLQSLGLKKPDPVDDVIENVLPTYRKDDIDISNTDYEVNIERILNAFATDSETQREKLVESLKNSTFVKSVDIGDGSKRYAKPGELYLATKRLRSLFEGVVGILFVDYSQRCLHGENIRELLERCGAVRHLRSISDSISDNTLLREERRELRKEAGHPETSGYNDKVKDFTLKGLEKLLAILPNLDKEKQQDTAMLLWDELAHLEESLFTGDYNWSHYGSFNREFPAAFVRRLNTARWVLDADGELQCPEFVLFDSLDWKKHPFLQSKIRFKPPIIQTLAEAGRFRA